MTQKRRIWDTWDGKRAIREARPGLKKEEFIATTDEQWSTRFQIWKNHLDDGCPCPMPAGHIMFDGNDTYYKLLPEYQQEQLSIV